MSFFDTNIVAMPLEASISAPPPVVPLVVIPPTGLYPIPLPPLPRLILFVEQLIIYGQIRRLFTQEGYIAGRIRRLFADGIAFSATAVKRVKEKLAIGGFIVNNEDIPDHAWEALFEAIEKEEEELIE